MYPYPPGYYQSANGAVVNDVLRQMMYMMCFTLMVLLQNLKSILTSFLYMKCICNDNCLIYLLSCKTCS